MSGWCIDPDSLALTSPDRRSDYTAAEFAEQAWPPCPVCGTTIDVDRINTRAFNDPEPIYMPGRWRCPRGCDPRA